MKVAQNRGLTLCPIDGCLSDSDDETPEDLVLRTSLSTHLREDSFIDFVQRNALGTLAPSLRKVNLQNDFPIMALIAVSGANKPYLKYALRMLICLMHWKKIVHGMRSFW